MARPLRIEYEGAFYHVTARGNERRKIYYAEADYEKFKSYLRDAQEKYGCQLHCYVLMTNHYHLLIETPNANMSKVMHHINGSYTNHINRKRKRSGHLFQGRYKAILIDRDSYLLELSRYVHLNPVRAKMVAKPEDYPHSSYRSFISNSKEDIVYHDLILDMISTDTKDSRKRYRDFVEGEIEEGLENPLKNVYGGAILGGKTFIRESLGRLKGGILQKEEIAYRKELQAAYGSDDVIETICAYFKVSREDVFSNCGEYRNMAIYLMKKLTGMTNKQIGHLFGGLSYSAVAKVYQRFSAKAARDKLLKKSVRGIRANLS
ncbi:MAG: transposase [Syntrophales bacterium]|nr:transposase [Syntrophales bacterium]